MSFRIEVNTRVAEIVCYLNLHEEDAHIEVVKHIDAQLLALIKSVPLGGLGIDAVESLDEAYFKKIKFQYSHKIGFWETYKQWNHYSLASAKEKSGLFKELERDLVTLKTDILINRSVLNEVFVRIIYESNCPELVGLFEKIFPRPPLSIFDVDKQPKALVEMASKRAEARAVFDARNAGDASVEQKVMYFQRHIRAAIRAKSELARIGERYCKGIEAEAQKGQAIALQELARTYEDKAPEALAKALTALAKAQEVLKALPEAKEALARKMIEDANTPYIPRQCSRELARRILRITGEIKLFTSVTHLLAASNIAQILDGFLYGRENLINSYIPFRNASLFSGDIENGDGNVICLGPDKIDPKCFKDRTVGLELDLDMLISGKELDTDEPIYGDLLDELLDELACWNPHGTNPALFYKQKDLGFDTGENQSVIIGDKGFIFSHTKTLRRESWNHTNLQMHAGFYSSVTEFYAEIEKDRLISSNIGRMHQILTLNFFRFLDKLKDVSGRSAMWRTKEIYDAIEKLDDEKLEAFLIDLGKKMSCSSEFNITGAYKINPRALRRILIYDGGWMADSIVMNDLCNQLNGGNFECLNRLEKHLPEMFKSTRFVNFLLSKVQNPIALEKLRGFMPTDQACMHTEAPSKADQEIPLQPIQQNDSEAAQGHFSQPINDWDRIWNSSG